MAETNTGARPFTRAWLQAEGFSAIETVKHLRESRCASVPSEPGVYVVVRTSDAASVWLEVSTGGHFKGRDPSVPIAELESRYIRGAPLLYIGKADSLKRRLSQYVRFGIGARIGHWGGRYIWQLEDSAQLQIAWAVNPQPRKRESELMAAFVATFGRMPLANLVS